MLFLSIGCSYKAMDEQEYKNTTIVRKDLEEQLNDDHSKKRTNINKVNDTPDRDKTLNNGYEKKFIEISTSYYNPTYNFWIDIPTIWEDAYEIVEKDSKIEFYFIVCGDIKVKNFTIYAWTHEEFEDLLETMSSDRFFIEQEVLGKNKDYGFHMIAEISLDALIESEECMQEWRKLGNINFYEMRELIRLE